MDVKQSVVLSYKVTTFGCCSSCMFLVQCIFVLNRTIMSFFSGTWIVLFTNQIVMSIFITNQKRAIEKNESFST